MAEFDSLPPLRDIIKKYQLHAKKSLGQNFLLDLNITDKIARQAGDLKGQTVIEIGPGPGGLTRALLMHGAKILAIEYDPKCIPALNEIAEVYPNQLSIIEADALKLNFIELLQQHNITKKVQIIANLPYNIGTPLFLNWLLTPQWPPFWSQMILMFQKEVAQRISAQPNDSDYGRLAVLSNWRCESQICFDLPPTAFSPPPKVTSSIIKIKPRAQVLPCKLESLDLVTKMAFQQRRKMLRQSLKALGGESLLNAAHIAPERRAETLSVEEFVRLAQQIHK